MSSIESFSVDATIPSLEDFAERFRQYGPRAREEGRPLFDLVMNAETFVAASTLTRYLRIPAVTAVADRAVAPSDGAISDTNKQFLGALMCCLMEHNGFAKTGRKGSVPHPAWNRGEIYTQV